MKMNKLLPKASALTVFIAATLILVLNSATVYAAPATKSHPASSPAKAHCNSNQTPTPITVHGKKKWYCKNNPHGSGPHTATPYATNLPQVGTSTGKLKNILTIVFGIAGAAAFLVIVISGLRYILSQGDPQSTAKARNGIIYALIGLMIAVTAEAIVNFVVSNL